MLFDSSLRKELGRSFSATLLVLLTIVMTVMLIRTLGLASRGAVNPSEVIIVMGFTVLGYLPTILTLSLFISISSTLSRMYLASEMVVWFSSGRGILSFLRPVLRFSWPIFLSVFVLALWIWPWSNTQVIELRKRYQSRSDIEKIAPGSFIETQNGNRVFFVDKENSNNEFASNILIFTKEANDKSVSSAQSGRLEDINGRTFVILENGQRLENLEPENWNESGKSRLTTFEKYANVLSEKSSLSTDPDNPRLLSSSTLLSEAKPAQLSELSWRLGLFFAVINCAILAVAATKANPRTGKSAGLAFSIFAFITYYNFISVGQDYISTGKIEFIPLMIILHGGIFLISISWLLARHYNFLGSLARR